MAKSGSVAVWTARQVVVESDGKWHECWSVHDEHGRLAGSFTGTDAEARARLVAAAPVMLDKLQRIARLLDDARDRYETDEQLTARLMAHEGIAASKGPSVLIV